MRDLSLDPVKSISGFSAVVAMQVTHPECPLRIPFKFKVTSDIIA